MVDDKVFPDEKWKKLITPEREKSQSTVKFFEISKPAASEIWADIGCGPGFFTLPVAKKVKSVFAVDLSSNMLEVCKKRAIGESIENIKYIQSEGEALGVLDGSAHKALLANVFHEFRDRKKAVGEVNRILQNGGKAFVIDWKYEEMPFGPPLSHRVPLEQVVEAFEKEGFTLVENSDIYKQFYMLCFVKN